MEVPTIEGAGAEMEPEEQEPTVREIMVSGRVVDESYGRLQQLAPEIVLEGKSLKDLEELEWEWMRKSQLTTSRQEEQKFLESARALGRFMSCLRPNNSILGIEKDPEGKFQGLRLGIRKIKNKE